MKLQGGLGVVLRPVPVYDWCQFAALVPACACFLGGAGSWTRILLQVQSPAVSSDLQQLQGAALVL